MEFGSFYSRFDIFGNFWRAVGQCLPRFRRVLAVDLLTVFHKYLRLFQE